MIKRKLIKASLVIAAAVMMMTGCKSEEKNETSAETTAAAETTAVTQETKSEEELTDEASIEIGNYKGLELTSVKEEVTDAKLEDELKRLLAEYPAEVTGRPAKDGDTANIDYVGTKDGVAFAGGTADGYDLVLGSGTFIDGFEDGVIGMNVGEEKDLNLTFPESYGNADLAGQDVVFHVTLNYIKNSEGTKIDDSLAQRVMGDDTATLEQLKSEVYNGLVNQAESNFFNAAGSELLAQAIENSNITCDPDAVDDMYNQLETTYTAYASQYGMDLDNFLSLFLQTDTDGLKETAENLVKQEMVLNEIIKNEQLAATDEQKDKLAQMNYFADADAMISTYGEESANRLFEMGAAYYYLIDNAVVTEAPETETEAAAEAATGAAEVLEMEAAVGAAEAPESEAAAGTTKAP